jgi:hypothetical protein
MKARPVIHAGIDRPERKKIGARLHVTLQGEAYAQHKDEIDDHDGPINER